MKPQISNHEAIWLQFMTVYRQFISTVKNHKVTKSTYYKRSDRYHKCFSFASLRLTNRRALFVFNAQIKLYIFVKTVEISQKTEHFSFPIV